MTSHIAMHHQNQHPDVSVFVRNLSDTTDEKALKDVFMKYGNIVSCKLAFDEKGKSKGYAFVQYESEEAAREAIDNVNGTVIDEKTIFVGKFVPRRGRNKERDERNIYTNLYVKNFGNEFTEDQLRQLFEPYGKIKSHKIMADMKGRSKGFGFVAYEKAEYAEEALIHLFGKKLNNGRKLFVARAQKKAERQQELQRQFEDYEESKQAECSFGINLYVKNLDDSITHAHLRREFSQYGPLSSARVMTDNSGRSKGFGFVRFISAVDACFAAAGMNGRMFGTKPLYVSLAQRKEERRALLVAQHMRQRLQASESYELAKGFFRYPHLPNMFAPIPLPAAAPHPTALAVAVAHSSSSHVGKNSPAARWSMSMAPQRSRNPLWRSSSLAPQIQLQCIRPARSRCNLRYSPSAPFITGSRLPLQLQTKQSSSAGMVSDKAFNSSYPSFGNNNLTSEKQIIGERLFFVVEKVYPLLAGKITGMILEMCNAELWFLLGNAEALRDKIEEAYQVYRAYLKEIRKGNCNIDAE